MVRLRRLPRQPDLTFSTCICGPSTIIDRRLDRVRSRRHRVLALGRDTLTLYRSIATGVAPNKVALIVFVALTGVGAAANTPTGELI